MTGWSGQFRNGSETTDGGSGPGQHPEPGGRSWQGRRKIDPPDGCQRWCFCFARQRIMSAWPEKWTSSVDTNHAYT